MNIFRLHVARSGHLKWHRHRFSRVSFALVFAMIVVGGGNEPAFAVRSIAGEVQLVRAYAPLAAVHSVLCGSRRIATHVAARAGGQERRSTVLWKAFRRVQQRKDLGRPVSPDGWVAVFNGNRQVVVAHRVGKVGFDDALVFTRRSKGFTFARRDACQTVVNRDGQRVSTKIPKVSANGRSLAVHWSAIICSGDLAKPHYVLLQKIEWKREIHLRASMSADNLSSGLCSIAVVSGVQRVRLAAVVGQRVLYNDGVLPRRRIVVIR